MANLSKEDGSLPIQSSADLMERTDAQLLAVLPHTNVAGVALRESITAELQRRELVRLSALTRTLERLTRWLIGWTVVIVLLTGVLLFFTIVLVGHERPEGAKTPPQASPVVHALKPGKG